MKATIISYFTPEAYYADAAARLKLQCCAFGLKHIVVELPPTGSWVEVTRGKPAFILSMLLRLQSPVLWTDVDNQVLRSPSVFDAYADESMDMVVPEVEHSRRAPWMPADARVDSAVVWCNFTAGASAFLEEWARRCRESSARGDHSLLTDLWAEVQRSPKAQRLARLGTAPPTTCQVVSTAETIFQFGNSPIPLKRKEIRESLAAIRLGKRGQMPPSQ